MRAYEATKQTEFSQLTVPDILVPARTNGSAPSAEALSRARELRLDRLLLPLDGSDESEQTISYAALISRRVGGELNLFHCLQPMHPVRVGRAGHVPYPDAQHDRGSHLATAYLQEVKARLKPHGLNARWNVATGSAPHLIAYRAATGNFGLTLLAAHTKPRVMSGIQTNVTGNLWKLTAGPLFLINRNHIRLNGTSPPVPETIFIPVNEPETFEAALPIATTLARILHSRLVLLVNTPEVKNPDEEEERRPIETPEINEAEILAEELRTNDCYTEVETIAGGVIGVARRQLQERGSWVVAGSHMRSGLGKLLKGSKGDNFLRQCRGPLIVVPNESVAKSRAKKIRKKVASADSVVSLV